MEIIDVRRSWSDVMECFWKICDSYGITAATYNTWLLGLEPEALNEGVLTVRIPSDNMQMATYYEKKYKLLLEAALEECFGEPFIVKFVPRQGEQNNDLPCDQKTEEESCPQARTLDKNAPPDRYRFENFVVGDSNRFAYFACLNAADNIKNGTSNPIYLYGGTGVGKTHLLRAFQLHVYNANPQIKTEYLTGDKFAAIVREAIQNAELNQVYDEFEQKDLFIIDAVEALNGDIDVQRAFKYVYDDFCSKKKPIIISSIVSPDNMMFVEDWIKSRLVGGLVIKIEQPDEKMRMEILLTKNTELGLNVPQSVLGDIAEEITSVQRAIGLLVTLAEYMKLTEPCDIASMAHELLMDYASINAGE